MSDVPSAGTRLRELIPAVAIRRRVEELAAEIALDHADEDLVLVCVLKGSMVFFVDLARELPNPVRFDYLCVASYDEGTESSGTPRLRADLTGPIAGKHVLIVEDIVDTGRTARFLLEHLGERGPASLQVVALLDKPSRRQVEVDVAYTGFTIPDEFVVGYGLDHRQRWRNLPSIAVLETVDDEPGGR